MASDSMCWCASEIRCPHGISAKLPILWDDMETVIDDILQNFDRKTIKKFLKRDSDGNAKLGKSSAMKDAYVGEKMSDKLSAKGDHHVTSSLKSKRHRQTSPSPNQLLSQTLPSDFNNPGQYSSPLKDRPETVGGYGDFASNNSTLLTSQRSKNSKSAEYVKTGFSRDGLTSSLPKLPPRALSAANFSESPQKRAQSHQSTRTPMKGDVSFESSGRKQAWSSSKGDASAAKNPLHVNHKDIGVDLGSTEPVSVPDEATINVGLMRVADNLARKVLPWQAVLCPRAVETLHDLRQITIQNKHNAFIDQMKAKLEEKVMAFIKKKDEEVEIWIEKEVKSWQQVMKKDEVDLIDFIKRDLERISDRAAMQDKAYRARELTMATAIDDHERDSTREQLVNFRRIVRSNKELGGENNSVAVELRALQDSMAKAQKLTHQQMKKNSRDIIKRLEESHDWLCSLADNAITAAESEQVLKVLYSDLDEEKSCAMESLRSALDAYKEQHHAILEAITIFAGRIHQHATDFLQREQLISRAFQQYLLSIVSGEIKTHATEQKKTAFAWETKGISDRAHKKEQALTSEYQRNINPLDKLVSEFKDRMRVQLDHITLRLQSVLNGRENDVNSRKAAIHRKLAKHVNKACSNRRMRLKDATAGRREEFELEERAIAAVDDLTADLRGSIDTIWVKEHLKERRMYEATVGRMDRLQKSALIIWNKHAHLAIGEKEEYDDWLEMYKKERDMKIFERRAQLDREWKLWRTNFGVNARRIALGVKTPLKTLIEWSFNFDVTVPVDKNLNDLSFKFHDLLDHISAYVGGMRDSVEKYLDSEIRLTDSFAERSKQILLLDWQDNLHMLNNSINRRVGTLKDMESDLEETIRLTILQHEVENAVFEQLSCNRLEYFWIEWRNKMFSMCKQLKETQEDYQISKNLGKSRTRKSRKDRALDDLLALSRETAPPSKVNTLPPIDSPSNRVEKKAKLILGNGETSASEFTTDDDVDQAVSDTVRMKKLLDEIRPEVYRDFKHKMSRGLERIRRDLGEGKRRLVPPFAVCKTLLLNTDKFWDSARLSERCVGKLSSRGILLFKDGLPNNARALFCTASALSVMSSLTMVDNLIDCDDVFEILEHNQKQTFLIGLLSIALRIGSYGSYCIRQECLWACSTLGVEAPPELIRMSDAKGLDKNQATDNRSKGFYSDDSIDLANSVIALPTDPEAIRKLQETYNKIENLRDIPNVQNTVAVLTNNKQEDINTSNGLLEGPAILLNVEDITEINASTGDDDKEIDDIMADMAFGYKSNHVKVFNDLMLRVPLDKQIKKMSYLIPSIDITVLVSMLGRPDGSMELTPHRLCQVVSTWRRAALAIVTAAFDPPSSEYPRVGDLVTAHNANMTGRKRMGYGNISSVSPYEAVSSVIDWYTSIKGLPLSVVQGMCLMSRSGSCDPWLEDPKQSQRHQRLAYELNEMIDVYASDIPKSFNHNEFIQATVVDNILEVVKSLDLNGTGLSPLEMLRVYVQREDLQLTNNQITAIFWSVCRTCDDPDEIYEAMENSANDSYKSFQSGGVYKPIVATSFLGDPQDYMKRFSVDVDKYLESMPTIDINTVMGMLGTPLVPASAHELVADAMKLDASSRNAMPTSCCIWLGQRAMPLSDAIEAITVPSIRSKEGNKLIGVGCKDVVGRVSKNKFQSDLRTHVEIDLLTKYPEMCDIHASDKHYGPAGNEPINASGMSKDHWEELMSRRLARVDKLTLSWRDTMLNEWATSLYQSRHSRYVSRVDIIRQCVGVYHKQYRALRDGIINERGMLLSKFSGIEAELLSLIQEDYNFFTYHSSYLERALRRYEGQLERMILILKDILIQFQRHCGTIKRRAIARVVAASEKLKEDLEMSCNGLIMGYTAGYAQGYFDELLYRGEIWRKVLTDLQGQLIAEKEKFITAKDEVDRDVTIQVTDRLTLDRNKTKGYMDSLTEDTAKMLDILANTRASYASIQKDTNARLILRIEKAVRESRKLRVAAEQQAELEAAALRDIRYVLDTAKTSCLNIVHQVSSTSMQQLKAFEPLRKPHREKMETRIKSLEQSWNEVESVVMPLVDDYEREMHKQLRLMKAICMDLVGRYRDSEINALSVKYKKERTGLVTSFRKHFREYDLSEAAIFERFNREIVDTVKEMNALWGPSRPKFIVNNLLELERIPSEAMRESYADIQSTMHVDVKINDEVSLSRMEIADMFSTSLQTCYDTATVIPVQFVREKKDQLVFIDQMSMEKNGDMIRPQVKAVLDLLISGLEIDYDFGKGYESLISATHAKADESVDELTNFVGKYSDANVPISIGNSAEMTRARINRRKDEVNALLDASRAHVVADHSRLDVLVNAGEKDIEEWTSLTLQLVENAFHNAELSYLSNLWPTPPATPRIELVPEEEDRVGKLKALLNVTHNDSVNHPQNITNSMALVPADQADEDDFDDDELREARAEKERKRAEKENRRQEKAEREAAERALNDDQSLSLSTVTNLKPDETRELQNGWLECVSTEGYKYYFNSMTGESLWDLPAALKIPLYPDEDKAEKLIETPRALLQDLEPIQNDYFDGNASGSASIAALGLKEENSLVRIVPADYSVNMQIDRKQIMADIAQESRAIATLAIDTALDITRVIRGRKGKDERTIAKILAEKLQVDPSILNLPPLKSSESDYRVSLYPYHTADETESTDSVFQAAKDGKLISDTGSAVESDLAGQLLELGMGSERSDRESRQLNNEIIAMPRITEGVGESSTDLLNLGLNGNIHEDDEHIAYNEFNDRNDTVKRIAHEKYSEAREQDLMTIEEQISIGYENEMEDKNCREFMSKLQHLIQANTAFEEDKRQLQVLGSVIKPINLVDIMVGLSSSWEKIEIIIAETKSREFERQQLEERMKSEEGMRRQQTILDHSEDIEEMTNFLKNQANQSKINARRVATELILKNISTPKKLAKIWNRKHIDLKDFALDHDDIEELETALTKLLMDASAMGDSFIANRAVVPSGVINNQLILDPNMVTEVVDDYEDDQNSPSHAGNKSLQQGSLHSPSMRKDSHYHFTYTADGYKSFKGGWIEGVDNENNVYYYNTVTGGSSWTLPPDLTEEYDSNSHLVGSQLSVVSEHFEHYHGPYDLQNREVHEPANNFSDVYSDEHLQNYGYHAGQDDNQYDGSYHYQGEESNNNNESNYNYPDEYGDSNHQYDGTIQNYDENYYDPNTHYDGNEGVLTEHHSYEPYEGYTDIGDPNHYDNQENYDNYYNGDPNHYESTNDNNDGVWDAHEAYPDDNQSSTPFFAPPPTRKPVTLPVPVRPEVAGYSKKEGVNRQLTLLHTQDKWQNILVKTQHFITEQKSLYLQKREEMFNKVTTRVEARLAAFVDDIKFMQKTIKKDLGDSNATERDVRRLFDEDTGNVIKAEKLSFILESIEKLKENANERFDSAHKQMEKFAADWILIKAELRQVGDIYDEGVAANLEQCRLACEHNAKVFAYDLLKYSGDIKKMESRKLRNGIHRCLRADTFEEQENRRKIRLKQEAAYVARERKRHELLKELGGWDATIEAELEALGYPAIAMEQEICTEEEFVMSYMLTQIEMELALKGDYDSITEATKSMAVELHADIQQFDENERQTLDVDGSWFNKHHETIERHENALNSTLAKVRTKVTDGYQLLKSKIEVLDYEVERAAEEELFQG